MKPGRIFKREKVLAAAHHRNGVCGEPFEVAIVDDGESKKVVILFEKSPDPRCAVLDIALLAEGNIEFGENSWRGDHYDAAFRGKVHAKIMRDFRKRFPREGE